MKSSSRWSRSGLRPWRSNRAERSEADQSEQNQDQDLRGSKSALVTDSCHVCWRYLVPGSGPGSSEWGLLAPLWTRGVLFAWMGGEQKQPEAAIHAYSHQANTLALSSHGLSARLAFTAKTAASDQITLFAFRLVSFPGSKSGSGVFLGQEARKPAPALVKCFRSRSAVDEGQ